MVVLNYNKGNVTSLFGADNGQHCTKDTKKNVEIICFTSFFIILYSQERFEYCVPYCAK